MQLKLEILDTYINFYIKFQNFSSSFGSTNNFVNLVALVESQFPSTIMLVSKIYIKLETKSNLMKQNLLNKLYMSSFKKDKVLKKNCSENICLNSRYSYCLEFVQCA